MRFSTIVVGLAAMSATAQLQAQSDGWQVYEAEGSPTQAFVVAADGSQLILKCDKPGKRAVYAVIVTQEKLVPPNRNGFAMRPIFLRFDSGGPIEERWRYYETSVMAVNKRNERPLVRLVEELANASTLEVRLQPGGRSDVETSFNVGGASEAIAQVYDSCRDENPAGG